VGEGFSIRPLSPSSRTLFLPPLSLFFSVPRPAVPFKKVPLLLHSTHGGPLKTPSLVLAALCAANAPPP
jgi:hypothetical protein